MTITYRDGVAIGAIVCYIPILAVGFLLCLRHGFGRSSGWFFLIMFSIIRIVGASFQLATISNPTSTTCFIAVAILQNIGLSPLELISLGLISRVISNINKTKHTVIQPTHIKMAQLLVLVALILGIVGGTNSFQNGVYKIQIESKVALGLLIGTYVLIIIFTGLCAIHISHADHGEKRVLLAVALVLPFMLVRLIYSALFTFSGRERFSSIFGSVTLYLVLGIIMELICMIIYESIGVTLKKVEMAPVGESFDQQGPPASREGLRQKVPVPQQDESAIHKVGSFLGKRTLIGKIVVKVAGGGQQQRDVEMQGRQQRY